MLDPIVVIRRVMPVKRVEIARGIVVCVHPQHRRQLTQSPKHQPVLEQKP
jgi:hypothetical protein